MAAAALGSIGCPDVSNAATLNVPGDFATIQACISAAVSGVDECVVAPGRYHETIDFLGKAIALRSSGGADVTTIDATGIGGSVVTCASGEGPNTILDGFTITGGTGPYAPSVGGYAGGGMYNLHSSPTVTNCTFNNNYVRSSNSPPYSYALGGGMCNFYGSPTVTHCTFNNNGAFTSPVDHPGLGGGMYNYYSSTSVTDCEFGGNTADAGGGMYNENSNPTVTNCTFSGNVAWYAGGGMCDVYSGPTLTNCTFSGNTILSPYPGGGGMYDEISSPTLTDCILWSNSPDQLCNDTSSPTIRFSDVQGGLPDGTVDGGGNLDLDPIFVREPDPGPDGRWDGVDDDYGDLRLRAGSPCIDEGDPGFVAQPAETDLEGHARVLCGRVDMGAYEYGIGDYDCDQSVNLTDLAGWVTCVTGPTEGGSADPPYPIGCEAFDFDGDGDVDLLDFSGFQRIIGR
jgi:hypothetical protein